MPRTKENVALTPVTQVPEPVFPIDLARWRRKAAIDEDFGDHCKALFLVGLLQHGKISLAAAQAGSCVQTIRNHRKTDEQFETMVHEVLEFRSQKIVRQLEEEALAGFEEPVFNKEGIEIGTKIKYETQLRLAILKRYDPEYREKAGTDVNVNVGVLVAPGKMSPAEWAQNALQVKIKQQEAINEDKKQG